MSTYRYPVVIEGEGTDYGAYVPDLPGCIAVGDSSEEVLSLMRGALRMYLAAMVKDGDPIPKPSAPEALHLVPGVETVHQLEVEVGGQV